MRPLPALLTAAALAWACDSSDTPETEQPPGAGALLVRWAGGLCAEGGVQLVSLQLLGGDLVCQDEEPLGVGRAPGHCPVVECPAQQARIASVPEGRYTLRVSFWTIVRDEDGDQVRERVRAGIQPPAMEAPDGGLVVPPTDFEDQLEYPVVVTAGQTATLRLANVATDRERRQPGPDAFVEPPDAGGDLDDDEDGWLDSVDNCPAAFNPEQGDRDFDDAGDACDCAPETFGFATTVAWHPLDSDCSAAGACDAPCVDGEEDECLSPFSFTGSWSVVGGATRHRGSDASGSALARDLDEEDILVSVQLRLVSFDDAPAAAGVLLREDDGGGVVCGVSASDGVLFVAELDAEGALTVLDDAEVPFFAVPSLDSPFYEISAVADGANGCAESRPRCNRIDCSLRSAADPEQVVRASAGIPPASRGGSGLFALRVTVDFRGARICED